MSKTKGFGKQEIKSQNPIITVLEFVKIAYEKYGKGVLVYPGKESKQPPNYYLEKNSLVQNQSDAVACLSIYDPIFSGVLVMPVDPKDIEGLAVTTIFREGDEYSKLRVYRDLLDYPDIWLVR